MAFADYYPLSQFQTVVNIKRDDTEGLTAFWNHRDEVFGAAVLAYLTDLRSEGRLGATGGLKGRDIWQAKAWNDFVIGKPAQRWFPRSIADTLLNSATANIKYSRILGSLDKHDHLSLAELTEANWKRLCKTLDAGNTSEWDWRIEDLQDQKSGDRCVLQFVDWKATLMLRDEKHNLVPASNIKPIPLNETEFDVPSGRLLITDYLRVEGFKEGIEFDADRDYRKLSLSSDRGQAARTLAHAADHNFGYVQTTNTCCIVHRHPETGAILVSQRWNRDEKNCDEDGDAAAPGWEKIGDFSCDMWRVTSIDREIAIARMRDGGNEKAEETLSTYLASNDCYAENIVQIDVPAGRLRLHSGPNFSRRVNRKRFGIPKGITPWLLLEPLAA